MENQNKNEEKNSLKDMEVKVEETKKAPEILRRVKKPTSTPKK